MGERHHIGLEGALGGSVAVLVASGGEGDHPVARLEPGHPGADLGHLARHIFAQHGGAFHPGRDLLADERQGRQRPVHWIDRHGAVANDDLAITGPGVGRRAHLEPGPGRDRPGSRIGGDRGFALHRGKSLPEMTATRCAAPLPVTLEITVVRALRARPAARSTVPRPGSRVALAMGSPDDNVMPKSLNLAC